jgi:hypothetical protein
LYVQVYLAQVLCQSPCDNYWYSLQNPAVVACQDQVASIGKSLAVASMAILGKQKSTKISPTEYNEIGNNIKKV